MKSISDFRGFALRGNVLDIGIQKPLNPVTDSGDIRTWLKTLL